MWRILFCFIIFPVLAFAGFERNDGSARIRALGGAGHSLQSHVCGAFYNPAALSGLTSFNAGFFYSPQPFGLSELSYSAGVAALPTSFGSLGASGRMFGFSLYKEMTFTVSYSKSILDVPVGVNINYHSLSIERYGSASTVSFDVGFLLPLGNLLTVGTTVRNISASTIGSSQEKLPQSISLGICYRPMERLSFMIDYVKEGRFGGRPAAGIEYGIIDQLVFRIGATDEPAQYSGGIGVLIGSVTFDYAYIMHEALGGTHEASIALQLGGNDNE